MSASAPPAVADVRLRPAVEVDGGVRPTHGDPSGGFVFRKPTFVPLEAVAGALATAHVANNDRGQIAGAYADAGGGVHGFVRTGQQVRTFDVPDALAIFPAGLNNRSQVAGFYQDHTGALHGFLRGRAGEVDTVDVRGNTALFDINDRGEAVGAYDYVGGSGHGFLRTPDGSVTTVDVPGSVLTVVTGINDRGQLVGGYVDAGATQNPDGSFPAWSVHGFGWEKGKLDRFDVPGARLTAALGVNDRGQIAGEYLDVRGRQRGFLAYRGHDTTITAPKRTNNIAWGINNRSEIIIPEPGTGIFGLG